MLAFTRIGVLELIASTAAAYKPASIAFWADRPLRRQFYSVMPQVVCAWARQEGCQVEYATYYGQREPERLLPLDRDLVFISAPSQQSALAYALARFWQSHGVTVVLAGPHARAFPADARRFADIVVTDCDRTVVEAILHGRVDPGTVVKCARPLADLPLVEERLPEIRKAAFAGDRKLPISTIATVSSLGCPYQCDFCSEWATRYIAPDTERLTLDLAFIAKRFPGALIGFHDPNFGVRFDATLEAFEAIEPARRNPFVMECTLSLLNERRLQRLRDANCQLVAPGIESWVSYSNKTKSGNRVGAAKLRTINAQIDQIARFIPAVQANVILGVDADAGDEPFSLTRQFICEHDTVWTNVNIPFPFGGTPLADRVRQQGRVVEGLPHMFYSAPYVAMHPEHYSISEYLGRMIAIYELLVSQQRLLHSLRAIGSWLYRLVWFGRIMALRAELEEMRAFRAAFDASQSLQRFYANADRALPAFFATRYRRRLGRLHEFVPMSELTPVSLAEDQAVEITSV